MTVFQMIVCFIVSVGLPIIVGYALADKKSQKKNQGESDYAPNQSNDPSSFVDSRNDYYERKFDQDLKDAQQKEDNYVMFSPDLDSDKMSYQERKDYDNLRGRGYSDDDIKRMDYRSRHR